MSSSNPKFSKGLSGLLFCESAQMKSMSYLSLQICHWRELHLNKLGAKHQRSAFNGSFLGVVFATVLKDTANKKKMVSKLKLRIFNPTSRCVCFSANRTLRNTYADLQAASPLSAPLASNVFRWYSLFSFFLVGILVYKTPNVK